MLLCLSSGFLLSQPPQAASFAIARQWLRLSKHAVEQNCGGGNGIKLVEVKKPHVRTQGLRAWINSEGLAQGGHTVSWPLSTKIAVGEIDTPGVQFTANHDPDNATAGLLLQEAVNSLLPWPSP